MNSVPKQAQKQEDEKGGGVTAELILEVNSERKDKLVQFVN